MPQSSVAPFELKKGRSFSAWRYTMSSENGFHTCFFQDIHWNWIWIMSSKVYYELCSYILVQHCSLTFSKKNWKMIFKGKFVRKRIWAPEKNSTCLILLKLSHYVTPLKRLQHLRELSYAEIVPSSVQHDSSNLLILPYNQEKKSWTSVLESSRVEKMCISSINIFLRFNLLQSHWERWLNRMSQEETLRKNAHKQIFVNNSGFFFCAKYDP